jgi:hypothetical protein
VEARGKLATAVALLALVYTDDRHGPQRAIAVDDAVREVEAAARESAEAEVARLQQERDEARQALAEAAREINCAGPVAHRIRVLRQEFAAALARLAAIAEYANHPNHCRRWLHHQIEGSILQPASEKYPCTCGLDALLASLPGK